MSAHIHPDHKSTRLGLLVLATVAGLLCLTGAVGAQTPTAGLANGFEIDGNLMSNQAPGFGGYGNDWLDGPAGPGAGVLGDDVAGTPKNPVTTLHILDLIKNADLDIFASSNKVFDDPNTYEWKGGGTPQKDDIQHGLVDFSTDLAGDRWISVAGDRRAVNGDSYIDFEFLQTPLFRNADGTFSSSGPHGGRTVGDILLTIHLTQGGSTAEFFAQRWESDGAGGYDYVAIAIPAGMAFVAANVGAPSPTTYMAFGANEYEINQFGEAAVNLSALLPSFDECFGIATVFVRTKSSASSDAELKDFIEPIQVNVCLDAEPPVLTCPTNITVSCDESYDPGDIGPPTTTDNCDIDPGLAYTDSVAPGTCVNETLVYRTWTATDACGNSVQCVQVITIVDDRPPAIISGPEDARVGCVADVPAPDGTIVVAEDACGDVTVSHIGDISNGGSCPEVITRTYRAVDACGNSVDYVQLITIDDDTPPRVEGPDDLTLECADDVPEPNTDLLTATDDCGGVVLTIVGDASDGKSCPETITRTYRATDACGNTTDFVQTITIRDTTPPGVEGPADLAVACLGEVPPPNTGLINATDNCGGLTVSFVADNSDRRSCPEVITRTYRVTDACGNDTDYIQTITINDTIPPSVDGPADFSVGCIGDVPPADIGLISAVDACGDVVVVHVGDVSDGESCPETITRTYRVTDACGNTVDFVQTIMVQDVTPPQVSCPSNIVVECAEAIPAPNVGSIDARDDCSGVLITHLRDDSDGRSCPQTVLRTYRVTDGCGNWVDCTQTITVDDKTPPIVKKTPDPIRVSCIEDVPAPDPLIVHAVDLCSEVVVAHLGDASDGNTCPELITRTYRVVDACGNYRDVVQSITIDDDVAPQITDPSDRTLECPSSWTFDTPTATDNCDPSPTVVLVDQRTVFGPEPWTMRMTRVWRAYDRCGNVSTEVSQTLRLHCRADGLCTFTQGFYGNYGGYYNGASTIEIIRAALAEEPLVVGKPGRSLTITHNAADCIVARLPAGSTPATLPPIGDANLNKNTCQVNGNPLPVDSEGKFVNVLLGQTITLTLNTRYNWPLLLFPLEEEFCTRADAGSEVEHFYIPASVLEALDQLELPRIVWGLLELANLGLAAMPTGGAGLSDINNAVDAINRGFDGCRTIEECPNPNSKGIGMEEMGGSALMAATPRVPTAFDLSQNYPNPFNPTTRIRIALPEATDWSLAIYNVAGQLVRSFDGYTPGPAFVDVEWDGRGDAGRAMASGVYFYRVKAGGYAAVKKMVLLK